MLLDELITGEAKAKISTASEAIKLIRPGRRILIGSGAAEPLTLVEALVRDGDHLADNAHGSASAEVVPGGSSAAWADRAEARHRDRVAGGTTRGGGARAGQRANPASPGSWCRSCRHAAGRRRTVRTWSASCNEAQHQPAAGSFNRGNYTMPSPIINTLLPVRQALDDLSAARESARVQLKLLSMEARERKDDLQTNFESLEHDIEQNLETALETAARRARDLVKGVQDFLVQHARGRQDFTAPVRSIMTVGVMTCEPGDSLNRAAQLFWDNDCGALPVLTSEGKLVGMITDRDICMAAYSQGCTLTAAKVESAMSRSVLSCELEDSIERALELMRYRQVRRLPVVHPDGRLAGIVSLADMARFARVLSKDSVGAYTSLGFTLAAISEPRATTENGNRAV